MRRPSPNELIDTIRALLPVLPEVRRFAATLAQPLDPVVADYLATHGVGWDWSVGRWFERLDVQAVDPAVEVSLQAGPVIAVLDWSALWLRWQPCRRTSLRLVEPIRERTLDALATIDQATGGQLVCDLAVAGHAGRTLVELVQERQRERSTAAAAQERAVVRWTRRAHRAGQGSVSR